ncbi:MAG TPA: urea carboxylase-associated family protein [Candidatus Udaeobacter sp.]|nr:urea carboxylase-associated family protein [Candidatus Udaeobacter sp.]
MTQMVVPASEGRAVRMARGKRLRLETPRGNQAADFFAFNAENVGEWLSCPHSWVTTFCIKPRQGDMFLSRFRRPMLRLVEDGAGGIHDMMIAACDQFRYEFFGHKGPHASCSDNLQQAMRREGYEISVIPQPINFFTHTEIQADGRLSAPGGNIPPGAFVIVEALMDLICVVSSCPYDLANATKDWEVNPGAKVTELLVEVK